MAYLKPRAVCPIHNKPSIACASCIKDQRKNLIELQAEKIKEAKLMLLDVIIAMSNKNDSLYSFVTRLKDYKVSLEYD